MELFLGFLILLSFCWMLAGLVKPTWALRWGKKRTRLRVIGWYFLFSFIIIIAIGVFAPAPQPQGKQTASVPTKPETPAPAKQPEAQAAPSAPAVDAAKLAEEKAAKEKVRQAEEAKKQAEVKSTVRRVMVDLMAMDKAASDPSVAARNMLKSVGKTASLGDVYGAMKRAKAAADDGFSRFMDYSVPNDLPQDVRDKLGAALRAFRQGAMVRGDIAKAFMKWLDTPKPSLANEIKEQSNQVTMDMIAAVGSLLEAMKAAGYTDAEATATLGELSGQKQTRKPKAKRKKS